MSGSGQNRLVISSYTFGTSIGGRPRPRATLTSTWVAFPALATLGAVSVAAISLSPAVDDKSLGGVQTMSGRDRPGVAVAGSNVQGLQPVLQVGTAMPQLTPRLAAEGARSAGQYTGVRQDELAATVTRPPARVELTAPASRIGVGQGSEAPARAVGEALEATAPAELLQPPFSSEKCAASCDVNRVALAAVNEESTLYSPGRPFTDVLVTVQSLPLVGDASSLKTEQLGFSAIVEPQPAPNPREEVRLASEGLDGQGENAPAAGPNELELTLADVVAAPDENETGALVAAEAAQTPVDEAVGAATAPARVALAVREHLARIDARYADKTIAAPAVPDIAADGSGQLAGNVEEISVRAAAAGTSLGSFSVVIAEDQLVSVRLGDLISLFQDKLERPLFVWMSTSSAATRFVTPETLAAAGLEVQFDPERRQIVLGVSD